MSLTIKIESNTNLQSQMDSRLLQECVIFRNICREAAKVKTFNETTNAEFVVVT